jgi:benzoyl-CoA 2,3-dioxygenase component B
VEDSLRGVERFNKVLEEHGIEQRLFLPSPRFNRRVGVYAGLHTRPDGTPIDAASWDAQRDAWLPTASDRAFIAALMNRPVVEPGKMAHWIAAPKSGLKGRPLDFEYVRLD